MILLLFNSLLTITVTRTVPNPNLETYKTFELLHRETFRCNCLNRIIPYESFISISPRIHQVCSSDFVGDRWLSIVSDIYDYMSQDWRNRAYGQFHILSQFCQLSNDTITNAIQQFLSESLILSNLLTEFQFENQINTTLNEFFQSTINSFVSLIDIEHIFTQTDQFYMGSSLFERSSSPDKYLIPQIFQTELNISALKVISR